MFRLVAISSLLVVSAAAGGAVSSSAVALRDLMQSSRPQDALASVQSAIRSAMASDLLSRQENHPFLNDRNLISQTCADEMVVALQSTFSFELDLPYYTEEDFCTFDSAMTDFTCDASKIPDGNALVAAECDSNGHAYAEATYVFSQTNGTATNRYEVNNLGICVGSSCTEDEVSDFFDLYSEFFQQFFGPLDDDTAPEFSITFTLEELGSSSSSRIMWSSSIFAGAVAVGLMLFWA